jgi:hypothetical protein
MKKILPIITIFVLLTPAYLGLAQIEPPIKPEEYPQTSGLLSEQGPVATLILIFTIVFKFMTYLASALAVIFFIWAGILYITGKGKTEKGDVAKDRLIWGVVGLVIALISWALVRWLLTFVKTGQAG